MLKVRAFHLFSIVADYSGKRQIEVMEIWDLIMKMLMLPKTFNTNEVHNVRTMILADAFNENRGSVCANIDFI